MQTGFQTNKPIAEEKKGLNAFRSIRKQAEAGSFPDLTLDDINEEIRKARQERRI